MNHHTFLKIVIFLFFFIFMSNSFTAAGKHPHNEFIFEIGDNVANILEKYNINVQREGESGFDFDEGFVMYSDGTDRLFGGNKSYSIYLYKANQIPLAARIEIVEYCIKIYEKRGRKEQYTITMRTEEFEPEIFEPKPFFRLTLTPVNTKE